MNDGQMLTHSVMYVWFA